MSNIVLWEKEESLKEIKEIFAPTLSNTEFKFFIELGKFTGLNPFLRELWAVKFGTNPAQIFIGRDGYRKSAQRHPNYDYHYSEAVYSNDLFESNDGIYTHKFNLKDRGILVGAYCVVKRKNSSKASNIYVELKEYNKGQSVWKDKPATMIKKVAEAQGLRMAFQELFAGTYDEAEDWKTTPSEQLTTSNKSNHQNANQKQEARLPNNSKNEKDKENTLEAEFFTETPNFGETAQDKRYIFRIASEIASVFNLDLQKDEETIKTVCRNVLDKKPTIENLEELINKTFYEFLKSKEPDKDM